LELEAIRIIAILTPWMLIQETSTIEVSPLLVMKKNRSYKTLADVSDARRRDTSLSIAPPDRIGMLSMGDQPPPRMPRVA
jgi:hypothetical protein